MFVAKNRSLGDCETNPEDPVCQEYYGGDPTSSTVATSVWDAIGSVIEGAQKLVGSISQIPVGPMPTPQPAPTPFYKHPLFLIGAFGIAAIGTYKIATRKKTRS